MKYEVTKAENGELTLKLGTVHSVSFQKGVTVEELAAGVEELIQAVVGVSAFELMLALIKKSNEDG